MKASGRSVVKSRSQTMAKTAMRAKAAKHSSPDVSETAGDVRPPGVLRQGQLSRTRIRRAVAAALAGKTFEADA